MRGLHSAQATRHSRPDERASSVAAQVQAAPYLARKLCEVQRGTHGDDVPSGVIEGEANQHRAPLVPRLSGVRPVRARKLGRVHLRSNCRHTHKKQCSDTQVAGGEACRTHGHPGALKRKLHGGVQGQLPVYNARWKLVSEERRKCTGVWWWWGGGEGCKSIPIYQQETPPLARAGQKQPARFRSRPQSGTCKGHKGRHEPQNARANRRYHPARALTLARVSEPPARPQWECSQQHAHTATTTPRST